MFRPKCLILFTVWCFVIVSCVCGENVEIEEDRNLGTELIEQGN